MNWNDWIHISFFSLHLGALVGTLLFQVWKGTRFLMRDTCDIPLLCRLLRSVVLFYYIPFLILAIRTLKVRYGYWYSVASLERAAAALRIPETVWLAGTVRQGLREMSAYRDSLWYMQAGSILCPLDLRTECENLQRRLGIRRKVRYRVQYMRDAAFAQGLFCPVIYLPMDGLDRQEREVVLCHELNHIRNGDALWMFLAAVLSCIYWFLPWMAEVREEVDVWSECSCDLATCRDTGSAKIYFDVLIRLVQRGAGGARYVGTMELSPDKKELYQRISMIRKHQKLEPQRKSMVAFTSALFLLVSSITVVVSTTSALDVYQRIYLFLPGISCEERESGERMEDIISPDKFGGRKLSFGETGEASAAGAVRLAWMVPEGVLGSSSKFRKRSGSTLSIMLWIEPADAVIWAGIVDPHGNLHYVSGERTLSYTFYLTSSGDYRFFLYNNSSKNIIVMGSYKN
ncbi:MAG: hypothetical protein LUF34_03310 [Lachnospiraceae bacterium]|nr:hypothetical protein [Lachnospiraceae bacterium]